MKLTLRSVLVPAASIAALGCSDTEPTKVGALQTGGAGGQSASGAPGIPLGGSSGISGAPGSIGGAAATAGAGGVMVPTGGAGGTGGASGGVGGASSAGGAGGAGSCASVDCIAGAKNEFGFAWKDSFFLTPCFDPRGVLCNTIPSNQPRENPVGGCPNVDAPDFEDSGFAFKELFSIGGEAGKTYGVTFVVNGVVEGKQYEGGTRDAGNDNPADPNLATGIDTFYVGGKAVPSHYNVNRMRILDANKTEVARYYLNSFPNKSWEKQETYLIGYTKTIDVPGGGFVEYLTEDSNCQDINNCGAGPQNGGCGQGRNVPNEPNLVIPPMFGGRNTVDINVINQAAQPWHSQIIHVTVTNVVAR